VWWISGERRLVKVSQVVDIKQLKGFFNRELQLVLLRHSPNQQSPEVDSHAVPGVDFFILAEDSGP